MQIYKNPWVSRESYFVRTGKARSAKNEASKSKGYTVEFWDGEWQVEESVYYNQSLNTMPVIASSKTSIQSVIDDAIISAVLDTIKEWESTHGTGGADHETD